MRILNKNMVRQLSDGISLPRYDRKNCKTGIVHFGMGAFHRAHQAVYTDTALGFAGGNWQICGVSLRSPRVKNFLEPQDYLYTVAEKNGKSRKYRLIGSINNVMFAPDESEKLLFRMTTPQIRIVSLTVTEKGYHHSPATGRLNHTSLDIKHDLRNLNSPKTVIGYLTKALAERRDKGIAPFTVLSCDNLSENGNTLRRVVLDFAALISDKLAGWIEKEVAFPCTMVDRIVPATTEEDKITAEVELYARDEGLVVTEPYCQWVIEDVFPEGRPAWGQAGVTFSLEVKAFEKMKLRFLNGSHSTLAYLGYLAGKKTIAECIQWTPLRMLIQHLMKKEILPTVDIPKNFNLKDYMDALILRFANTGLNHRLDQIAMDGSQKLPPRLLDPIRDHLSESGSANIDVLSLAVAGWMRYVCGRDEAGSLITISDPMVGKLAERTHNFKRMPDEVVENLLRLKKVFGIDLVENELFKKKVKGAFRDICTLGTRTTILKTLENVRYTEPT